MTKGIFSIALLFLSCAPIQRNVITTSTKFQIAYFWVTMDSEKSYFINAINFVDTGDMWILWTDEAPDDPEFLDVFQIDFDNRYFMPFLGRGGFKKTTVKEYVADLFLKVYKTNIKEIKLISLTTRKNK